LKQVFFKMFFFKMRARWRYAGIPKRQDDVTPACQSGKEGDTPARQKVARKAIHLARQSGKQGDTPDSLFK
jgi:hypothetical protein